MGGNRSNNPSYMGGNQDTADNPTIAVDRTSADGTGKANFSHEEPLA
jgi:hypothetical protein